MRKGVCRIFRNLFFFTAVLFLLFSHANAANGDDYSFDLEVFESKPFEFGGYAEIKWEHMDLNKESAFYYLNFYDDHRSTIDRFTGTMQLNGRYKKGIWTFNGLLNAVGRHDNNGWSEQSQLFQCIIKADHAYGTSVPYHSNLFHIMAHHQFNSIYHFIFRRYRIIYRHVLPARQKN